MEQFGNHSDGKLSSSNFNKNDIITVDNTQWCWTTAYGIIEINTNMYPKNVIFNWSFKYNFRNKSVISIGLNSTNTCALYGSDTCFRPEHNQKYYAYNGTDCCFMRKGEENYITNYDVNYRINRILNGEYVIKMSLNTSTKQLQFTCTRDNQICTIDNIDTNQKYYLAVVFGTEGIDSLQITDFFVTV
eukprot:136335_1